MSKPMIKVTTRMKRAKRFAKYAVKDARTAIYKALYGNQEHTYERRFHKRSNDPARDPSRRLSDFWNYAHAESVFKAYIEHACFPAARRAELEERLAALRATHKER